MDGLMFLVLVSIITFQTMTIHAHMDEARAEIIKQCVVEVKQ